MNRYIGTALSTAALLAQMQMPVCAQTADQVQSQMPQLQPAMSPTVDTSLRGPMGGQTAAPSSSPQPFSTMSSYSYREPSNNANSSYESQAQFTTPSPVGNPYGASSTPSKKSKPPRNAKHKGHGFSPVGAVLGVPDRAVKTSLGLTDRTVKTGLGIPAKTTKETFKAIF